MCMKHELDYSGCADWLTGDIFIEELNGEDCLPIIIEGVLGAKILDWKVASTELTALLDAWHERGLMVPDRERHGVHYRIKPDIA